MMILVMGKETFDTRQRMLHQILNPILAIITLMVLVTSIAPHLYGQILLISEKLMTRNVQIRIHQFVRRKNNEYSSICEIKKIKI